MTWSWRIGRLAGIEVYIHWTFLLLLAWIAGLHLLAGDTVWQALFGVVTILAFFGCIVLHELGHALAARRFGVDTRDITLLPIGGVARLERMPEDPREELLIAIAGPAVNMAIAAILFVILFLQGDVRSIPSQIDFTGSFLMTLFVFNVVVVLFNMLPAFPMDGGRVLRAFLATRMSYVRATTIAAGVGQAMAILFGLIGLLFNPFLLFIALFVYLGAEAEARAAQIRAATDNVSVRDAMMTRFRALSPDDPLQEAARELLAGAQQDFPVIENGQVRGVLCRDDLVRGLADGSQARKVRDVLKTDVAPIENSANLNDVLQQLQQADCGTVPVVQDGKLVGVLTLENIGELVTIRAAMSGEADVRPQDDGIVKPS